MANKRTIKALEELVKTEHMAIGALDAAQEEVEDNKLRKQYRKWRDSHAKQAEALNNRLEDLGGERIEYEVGSGKGHAGLWGKISSMRDDTSVEGMRIGAERGLKRYIDHIDDIDDPKALNIIRKNLEAKQDEMRWYDDQASKERTETFDQKVEAAREKNRSIEMTNGKKKGGLPFPLLVILGAVGAAAFFLLRKEDDDEYDDYGEDAFRYDGEETGTDASMSTAGATGSSDYSATASHGSNGGA
jgi:hypothetical protein